MSEDGVTLQLGTIGSRTLILLAYLALFKSETGFGHSFIIIDFFCSCLFLVSLISKSDSKENSMQLSGGTIDNLGIGLLTCSNYEIEYANSTAFDMMNVKTNDKKELKEALLKECGKEIRLLYKKAKKEENKTSEIQNSSSEFLQALRESQKVSKFIGICIFY